MQIFHSQKAGDRVRIWLEEEPHESIDGPGTIWRLKVQVKEDANFLADPSPIFQMALVDLDLVEFQSPRSEVPRKPVTANNISARYCIGKVKDDPDRNAVLAFHVHDHIARPVGSAVGYPASQVEVVLDECGTPITSACVGPDLTPDEVVEELWLKYADMVHFNETGQIAWREPYAPQKTPVQEWSDTLREAINRRVAAKGVATDGE